MSRIVISLARRAGRRSRRAARGGCAGRARRSARRGTAPAARRRARGRSRAGAAGRRCSVPTGRSSSSARPSASASSAIRASALAPGRRPTAGRGCSRLRRPRERPVDDRLLEHDAADAARAASGSRRDVEAARAAPCRRSGAIVVVSMPIVVDLPAPFGPSRPNTSPRPTSKSMPLTASTPPG